MRPGGCSTPAARQAATPAGQSALRAREPADDIGSARPPHPFPYQGSKRAIAGRILLYLPAGAGRLIEPFAGSAAVSLAAAVRRRARRFWLNDSNGPLMALWAEILERPEALALDYARLWREQRADRKAFFFRARGRFNRTREPHLLLYLLARIVKGAVRYNAEGHLNQGPDNRRFGMHPDTMRRQLLQVSELMANRTEITAIDFRAVVTEATDEDVLYLDPPYQGTSLTRDHRYSGGLSCADLVEALELMNGAGQSYLVSYDGRTGTKSHGRPLPDRLRLRRLSLHAGRSSQATLLGRIRETVESLYLSESLFERLRDSKPATDGVSAKPMKLPFAG